VQSAEFEGVRLSEPLQMGEAQLQRWGAGLLRACRAFEIGAVWDLVRDFAERASRERWVQR